MVAATPFRGRALPFDFRTYSSRTIEADPNGSRNLEHPRLLWDLDPDIPVVLDREFSYGELLEDLVETGRQFVIRLNVSSAVRMTYERGETNATVPLKVGKGEVKVFRKVYYKGNIAVNLAGTWRRGEKEPLWVMSSTATTKKKRANYSGLYILLRHKKTISAQRMCRVKRLARMCFAEIARPPSPVPT